MQKRFRAAAHLHKEDVGHIQLPHVVFVAELHGLAEDLERKCKYHTW